MSPRNVSGSVVEHWSIEGVPYEVVEVGYLTVVSYIVYFLTEAASYSQPG